MAFEFYLSHLIKCYSKSVIIYCLTKHRRFIFSSPQYLCRIGYKMCRANVEPAPFQWHLVIDDQAESFLVLALLHQLRSPSEDRKLDILEILCFFR